jgi:hypothetical protein
LRSPCAKASWTGFCILIPFRIIGSRHIRRILHGCHLRLALSCVPLDTDWLTLCNTCVLQTIVSYSRINLPHQSIRSRSVVRPERQAALNYVTEPRRISRWCLVLSVGRPGCFPDDFHRLSNSLRADGITGQWMSSERHEAVMSVIVIECVPAAEGGLGASMPT